MRTVIVDDETESLKQIKRIVKAFLIRQGEEPTRESSVHIFKDGKRLLEKLDSGDEYDIYFLDVIMEEINGLDLAKQIRRRRKRACIVFITSHREAALPSYQIRGCYFIEKERVEEELPELLLELWERQQEEQGRKKPEEQECYFLENETRSVRIAMEDILYLAKEGKYTVFHCRGKKEYRERAAFQSILERLPAERFVFIDKGMAIHINCVTMVEGQNVELRDGAERVILYASRRRIRMVRDIFNQKWRRE